MKFHGSHGTKLTTLVNSGALTSLGSITQFISCPTKLSKGKASLSLLVKLWDALETCDKLQPLKILIKSFGHFLYLKYQNTVFLFRRMNSSYQKIPKASSVLSLAKARDPRKIFSQPTTGPNPPVENHCPEPIVQIDLHSLQNTLFLEMK